MTQPRSLSRAAGVRPHAGTTTFVALVALLGIAIPGHAHAQQAMSYAPTAAGSDRFPDSAVEPDESEGLPDRLQRQIVAYDSREPAGSIVIDTGSTYLYYVLGGGRAIRYGVGVGREGFTWSGTETVSRKAEWPDWIPPAEMVARQPYLPRWVGGGPGNPLGARALYLGNSSYRIHGTNDPTSIGKFVSSGCIRMTNEDVIDLFNRVQPGAKVVVLPKRQPDIAARPAVRRVSTVVDIARGGRSDVNGL